MFDISLDSCEVLSAVDSVEVTKQRDSLAAMQTVLVVASQTFMWKSMRSLRQQVKDITQLITRKKKGLEKGNGQQSLRKRQWSTLIIESTADGTTANRTSELLPLQHQRHLRHWLVHIWTFLNTYTVS